jgi:S-adenosylmethionine:tRNA ribosyltransferase-isomerase
MVFMSELTSHLPLRPSSEAATVTASGTPIADYDYDLPEHRIAQVPIEPRSAARLLVGPDLFGDGSVHHAHVADLPSLLRPGDLLVVNETRVLPARLQLFKGTGGRAEVLLIEPTDSTDTVWEALVRPGRRLPDPTSLYEAEGSEPVIEVGPGLGNSDDEGDVGRRLVRLLDPSVIERAGIMPLPPYIHETLSDPDRYQTVYASTRAPGERSTAAPTAGLHLTPEVLDDFRTAGVAVATVDLAIGLDTFRPITAPTVEQHVIHSERYSVSAETIAACSEASRVIAVGTTVVRALESAASTGALAGRTDLYIHGEYEFSVVDVLITNFHLPRSSLLLLVESFCGPIWRELYATALVEGYRFLSFGDAMVVGRAARRPGLR